MAYFNGKQIWSAEVNYQPGYDNGYKTGYNKGHNEGYTEGLKDGEDVQQDAFWEAYQRGGKRTYYTNAFYGPGWNDNIYNPKYSPIVVKNGNYMFRGAEITDTKEPISLISGGTEMLVFAYSNLVTIRKLIIDSKVIVPEHCFLSCGALKNIEIDDNSYFKGNLDLSYCRSLTHDGAMNIIRHLYPGAKKTLTLHPVCAAKLSDDELDLVSLTGWNLATYANT